MCVCVCVRVCVCVVYAVITRRRKESTDVVCVSVCVYVVYAVITQRRKESTEKKVLRVRRWVVCVCVCVCARHMFVSSSGMWVRLEHHAALGDADTHGEALMCVVTSVGLAYGWHS